MKVLMLPDYTLQNPYQWLLARALEREEVHVEFTDGLGRASLLGAIRAYGRPDVVHIHWTHPFVVRTGWLRSALAAVALAAQLLILRAKGIGVVWTVHNLSDHERTHPRVERAFQRFLARFVDALIVHGPSARPTVARALRLPTRLGARIHVVPHGDYREAYPSDTSPREARARLGLEDEDRVVLYFGQLRRYRGVEQLLLAFAQLDEPAARLLIAGRVADQDLRRQVDECVARDPRVRVRYGFVPDDEVAPYLMAADVVALPYADVLTSGSALLALSFGRALVGPRLGCLPDVVDERGAILYPPGEPDALLRALEAALRADLAAMGEHNARAADAYGWDGIAMATRAVYERVARGPRRPREHVARRSAALAADPWSHRLSLARSELDTALGAETAVALVDDGQLSWHLARDRPVTPFPDRDGIYAGPPGDDAGACAELERLAASGSRYLVVAWPSFWWFDAFPRFRRRLNRLARCLLRTDRVAVFDLAAGRNAHRGC